MADEQIYIGPDEDLTSIRERLHKISNRHIVLVVPSQTQLRSHVSWRLLHSTARGLGKDIQIVSPDRQIRSVAKAAGFKAAPLQGTPVIARSRGGSSPSRFGLGGKTSPGLRTPPTRGSSSQQNVSPGRDSANSQNTTPTRDSAVKRNVPPVKGNAAPQRTPPVDGNMPIQDIPPAMGNIPVQDAPGETTTGIPQNDQLSQQHDDYLWQQQENFATGGFIRPHSSTFDPGDYDLAPASSVHPLGSSYEDEEPDLFLEDFRHAQSIREAAQTNEANTAVPSTGRTVPPQETPDIIDLSSMPGEVDDPLSKMVDDHPSSLPEQRGGVVFHHPDEDVADIANEPTGVLHIEDLGDTDDEFYHRQSSATLDWGKETLDPDEEQDIPGPPRVHGVRPRKSRTGGMQPPQSSRSNLGSEQVAQPIPPVYNQKTRFSPPGGSASPPARGAGSRTPPVAPTPPVRTTQRKPARPNQRPTGASVTQAPRTTPKAKTPQAQKPKKKNSGNLGLGVAGLASILVIFLIGLFAFLGPTADVTVTLRSHNYPLQLELTAKSASRMNVSLHTVPAQVLPYDASVSGAGHATGTTTVGTVQATGTVLFTNTSASPVVVPNNTIIATTNNVQFVTQAEVLVLSGATNTNLAPVQAVVAGTGGNVSSGSITVIPQESLTRIQQANPSLASIKLTVLNPNATTGGGAGSATTITNQDVTALKQQLNLQLQTSINAYIKKNTQTGDQLGKIVQTDLPPVVTPSIGSIVTGGSFLMTIKTHISVLVVKAATIKAASISEINAALVKQSPGLALVPQQPPEITKLTNKPSKDGNSIVLNFTAVGQVAPKIPDDTIRQLVSGKSPADAKSILKASSSGIPDVVDTYVIISPNFIHWVTFYQPHITVHYKAAPQPPKKK
ncbi:MAG TPA: baseplate J/gp47 family protein [Ktedonobacteraceae bacterium]|nr:baseplate J/gp47 family protein [Ktedonobacteraceae bacterium]